MAAAWAAEPAVAMEVVDWEAAPGAATEAADSEAAATVEVTVVEGLEEGATEAEG